MMVHQKDQNEVNEHPFDSEQHIKEEIRIVQHLENHSIRATIYCLRRRTEEQEQAKTKRYMTKYRKGTQEGKEERTDNNAEGASKKNTDGRTDGPRRAAHAHSFRGALHDIFAPAHRPRRHHSSRGGEG
jgi:hypothetical protein